MARDRSEQHEDRTQPPTPLRLHEARERGHVPRSTELTAAAAVLAGLLALALLGPGLLADLTTMTAALLDGRGGFDGGAGLHGLVAGAAGPAAARLGGMLALVLATAAAVGLLQVGPMAVAGRVRPDFGRVSPGEGLRRVLSARSAARAAGTVAKVALVAGAAYMVISPMLARLPAASEMHLSTLAAETARLAGRLGLWIGVGLLVLAVGDLLFQRWQYRRDLRMTRRDWLDDLRKMEVDPMVRQKRRQLGRKIARRADEAQ